eukprot:scaffold8329_cov112-Isochrysis_galbana.AAC.1
MRSPFQEGAHTFNAHMTRPAKELTVTIGGAAMEEEPTAPGTASPSWPIPRIRSLLAEERPAPTHFPLLHGRRNTRRTARSPLCPAGRQPLRIVTTGLQPVSTGVVTPPSPVHVELLDQVAAGFGAQKLLIRRSISSRSANLSPTSPISKKAGGAAVNRPGKSFWSERLVASNPALPSPVSEDSIAPISRVSLLSSGHTNKNAMDCRHPNLTRTLPQPALQRSEITFFEEAQYQPPGSRTVVGIVRMAISTTRPPVRKRPPVLSVDVPHVGGQALLP